MKSLKKLRSEEVWATVTTPLLSLWSQVIWAWQREKFRTLNFQRVNFQLFKDLVDKISWNTVLRDKGAYQNCQLFKDTFLRAQELSIPLCKKASRKGRQAGWLSKDLLVKVRRCFK